MRSSVTGSTAEGSSSAPAGPDRPGRRARSRRADARPRTGTRHAARPGRPDRPRANRPRPRARGPGPPPLDPGARDRPPTVAEVVGERSREGSPPAAPAPPSRTLSSEIPAHLDTVDVTRPVWVDQSHDQPGKRRLPQAVSPPARPEYPAGSSGRRAQHQRPPGYRKPGGESARRPGRQAVRTARSGAGSSMSTGDSRIARTRRQPATAFWSSLSTSVAVITPAPVGTWTRKTNASTAPTLTPSAIPAGVSHHGDGDRRRRGQHAGRERHRDRRCARTAASR